MDGLAKFEQTILDLYPIISRQNHLTKQSKLILVIKNAKRRRLILQLTLNVGSRYIVEHLLILCHFK